jgi:hypothetical protein
VHRLGTSSVRASLRALEQVPRGQEETTVTPDGSGGQMSSVKPTGLRSRYEGLCFSMEALRDSPSPDLVPPTLSPHHHLACLPWLTALSHSVNHGLLGPRVPSLVITLLPSLSSFKDPRMPPGPSAKGR